MSEGKPIGFKKTISITVPSTFSLIKNPDEMISFLDEVRTKRNRAHVFVNMRQVDVLTPDAIAALISLVSHTGDRGGISGNFPEDNDIAKILKRSGFYDHVRTNASNFDQASGTILRTRSERQNVKFNQFIVQELISFSTKHFRGDAGTHPASYSVLAEAMLNTVYHATEEDHLKEKWWASVYCDDPRRRACFTFIDQGVGIFKSHKLTARLNIQTNLKLLSQAELLRRLMAGDIPSSSKIQGRGNGIPGMYRHCKANRIRELTIISNKAMGNAEHEKFTELKYPFDGTIIYWEVEL